MKRMLVLAVLGLSGCVSITESKFTFIKVPPPVGVRFFVSSVELSEAVRTLPFGDKSASAVLSGRLRECLVNYRNDLFSAASDGAIPIKVNINVKPNRTGRLVSMGQHAAEICSRGYWDSGWQSIMLMQHMKIWSLIYEVRCEIEDAAKPQAIVRSINSDGSTIESPFLFAPILLPFSCFSDDAHFNGFGLFPGMTDDYDWLMEKEFADVMASAVAEFDIEAIKGGGGHDS